MFVISTERGAIRKVPMKPRFMSACAIEFGGSIDGDSWVFVGEFEDLQPFFHTERTLEFSKRFVAGNLFSFPEYGYFHVFTHLSSGKCSLSILEVRCEVFR